MKLLLLLLLLLSTITGGQNCSSPEECVEPAPYNVTFCDANCTILGACLTIDGVTGLKNCSSLVSECNGTFVPKATCGTDGPCCLDGECATIDPEVCFGLGGRAKGVPYECYGDPDPCATGICCAYSILYGPLHGCDEVVNKAECTAIGGTFFAGATNCSAGGHDPINLFAAQCDFGACSCSTTQCSTTTQGACNCQWFPLQACPRRRCSFFTPCYDDWLPYVIGGIVLFSMCTFPLCAWLFCLMWKDQEDEEEEEEEKKNQ